MFKSLERGFEERQGGFDPFLKEHVSPFLQRINFEEILMKKGNTYNINEKRLEWSPESLGVDIGKESPYIREIH